MNYDIIGDLHGDADRLQVLLKTLGYRDTGGAWRHGDRQAIFVGDFIDRGPQQAATCGIVRKMVDQGTAQAIMGNHEFNAIAWFTLDPDDPAQFLRRHTESNRKQHSDFLAEFEGKPEHGQITDWFKTLPLWLDLGTIRVIHAQWHAVSMGELAPRLGAGERLDDDLIVEGSRKGSSAFRTIEALLKGLEEPAPGGPFKDKSGIVRTHRRAEWWTTRVGMDSGSVANTTPVFFGHYSLRGDPTPLSPTLACVDYYRSENNPLVAYRWDGEVTLSKEKYVLV